MKTLGLPRSPSNFGISYSRIRCRRDVFPRQLAREPVILVKIVAAAVREDHPAGIDTRLQMLEELLHLSTHVGQEPVPEGMYLNVSCVRSRQKCVRARSSLVASLASRREDDPVDLDPRVGAGKGQQRPSTADLDVVRMTADRKDAAKRLSCGQAQHSCLPALTVHRLQRGRRGARVRCPSDGAPPSRCWSLIVSIGPKNPS